MGRGRGLGGGGAGESQVSRLPVEGPRCPPSLGTGAGPIPLQKGKLRLGKWGDHRLELVGSVLSSLLSRTLRAAGAGGGAGAGRCCLEWSCSFWLSHCWLRSSPLSLRQLLRVCGWLQHPV